MDEERLVNLARVMVSGVYFFPESVRVPCPSQTHSPCIKEVEAYPVSVFEYVLIEDCQGRGWTPATDGWVWWQAVESAYSGAGRLQRFIADWKKQWLLVSGDPMVAFFATLEKIVEKQVEHA